MRLRSVSSATWGSAVSGMILRMRGRNRCFPVIVVDKEAILPFRLFPEVCNATNSILG